MCERCEAILRDRLKPGAEFQTNDRRRMVIERVDGDDVHIAGGKGPAFHVSHAGALLHWLHADHFICAIGSGTTAIKTLVGKGGKLQTDCAKCAGNAAKLYAALAAMPGVRRDQQSGLAPDPATR